ncbi:M81 family metallopeptidase [Nisaea acidiphila]|uniref:Microcystinase C n=1 Tax=Nisaea acidiphila TaxID=1862145 RepID=A0A9J7AX96_9PROT|nr:M81 family metallopeptidase [Nisaea acidiphila]UUX50085.1 M81 family metallopeptidase [Nisaea acidiphila]
MARIIIGGFQHETNTFAPSKATLEAFTSPGSWPALVTGAPLFDAVKGINISVAGFIGEARRLGHELVPTSWAAASPSAHVTDEAFEHIAGLIVAGVKAALPADALYLCLHGAMVTESFEDGEGELIRRIREVTGPDLPILASLDLHANVTPEMVARADGLDAYRTYPHIDMAETGARVARTLDARLKSGSSKPARAFEQIPFLMPLVRQCTMAEPAGRLYGMIPAIEAEHNVTLAFATGFPAADIYHCGASVFAYGEDDVCVKLAVKQLVDAINAVEAEFAAQLPDPDTAVREAMRIAATADKPVVIADVQDNSGGGGDSDTTGLLRALISNGAEGAAIGLIVDPAAAEAAHAAGVGAEITLGLGGKSKVPGDAPYDGTFRVEALSDGQFTATGPFYSGSHMRLGLSARLSIGGVQIVVGSRKVQMADRMMYRFLGIEPEAMKILGNKSSVHYRADFAPIAAEIIECAAPGPVLADPGALPWKHLRPGLRVRPLGEPFGG